MVLHNMVSKHNKSRRGYVRRQTTLTYSELQYPTMTVYNKTSKKIIFALKRKHNYGYYLFEIHPENCTTDEEKQKLRLGLHYSKIIARLLDIPLFNIAEETVQLNNAMTKAIGDGKLKKEGDSTDVDISILDHATGKECRLTVGLTLTEDIH